MIDASKYLPSHLFLLTNQNNGEKDVSDKDIEQWAAKKIQKIWRGYLVRLKAANSFLSYSLFTQVKSYLANSNLQNIPLAPFGKTPVYLPKELGIVLKHSGLPANQRRFDQMQKVREICQRSHYQHLVIPKARVYREFIIESRLPIIENGAKEQIGLYVEHRDRFAAPIREFIRLLWQSEYFGDITGIGGNPYATLSAAPLGRYDNVALYLEGDQGKIGLIDLEGFHFQSFCYEEPKANILFDCQQAICLFPYHFEEIMSIARELDPYINEHEQVLKQLRDGALHRFKVAYEDHLAFLLENQILLTDPVEMVAINSMRQLEIQEAVISIIYKENKGELCEKYIETTHSIDLFRDVFPNVLKLTTSFLADMLNKQVGSYQGTISSYRHLVSCRTLLFRESTRSYQDLLKKIALNLPMINLEEEDKEEFASIITRAIFEALAKGREIAYYNPNFGYGSYAKHCLFC